MAPDMMLSPATPAIGFIHRKLADGDLYFVANTSNTPQRVTAHFRYEAQHAEIWDAFAGTVTGLSDPAKIDLDLAAYESRLIFFSKDAKAGAPESARRESVVADLSQAVDELRVWARRRAETTRWTGLRSWSEDAKAQFFSGTATYERDFDLAAGQLAHRAFEAVSRLRPRLHAGAYSFAGSDRIHDARLSRSAGSRGCAGFCEWEISGLCLASAVSGRCYRAGVHPGTNHLRIVVGRYGDQRRLAGQPLPDYRLLWARYGMRFVTAGYERFAAAAVGAAGAGDAGGVAIGLAPPLRGWEHFYGCDPSVSLRSTLGLFSSNPYG